MAVKAPMQQSRTTIALRNYDILTYLFDTLESRSKGLGRRTLAACVLVCRAWSDPASRVLWRRLDSLHPLWALLAGRTFPPSAKAMTEFWEFVEPDVFVKTVATKEPDRWKYFLYRASHVREVGTASCRESELALIQAVIKFNGGSTFLPTLQKIVWRHGLPSDTSLLILASSSLRHLELATTRFAAPLISGQLSSTLALDLTKSEPLFSGLALAAPRLTRLVISGRQLPGPVVTPHLLGLSCMRELYLYNDLCILPPEHLRSLLESMPELRTLYARLRDFSSPGCKAHSSSLRELRLHGTSEDMAGLLGSFLDAPFLDSLSLSISDDTHSAHQGHCLRALSTASFAQTLKTLTLSTISQADISQPPLGPYAVLVHPLASLRALEVVELRILDTVLLVSDEDILAVAQTWKHIRRLALSYIPSYVLPPISSLRHFAEHCAELRELSLTKMGLPPVVDVPDASESEDARPHPLRLLDLKMTFAGRGPYDTAGIARFLERYFPNMELREKGPDSGSFAAFTGTLDRIEDEIRALRAQKALDVMA